MLASPTFAKPAPHDREATLPPCTAQFRVYFRRALVCLEAHLATNAFVPTQRTKCKHGGDCPGYNTGDFLDRQYARARAGDMLACEYEYLRALGILFPLGDAREGEAVVVMRDAPIRAIKNQSPDYATYTALAWQAALNTVRDYRAKDKDLSPLFITKFHKDALKGALLMFNVYTAARAGRIPQNLREEFAVEGVILPAAQCR